jgi:hypothetical protein
VIGVVAHIVRGTGIHTGVIVKERLVAAKSVAAVADCETLALETGGVAGQTPIFQDGGWIVDEVDYSVVGVGGLRAVEVAEMVNGIQVIKKGYVADLAIGLG